MMKHQESGRLPPTARSFLWLQSGSLLGSDWVLSNIAIAAMFVAVGWVSNIRLGSPRMGFQDYQYHLVSNGVR